MQQCAMQEIHHQLMGIHRMYSISRGIKMMHLFLSCVITEYCESINKHFRYRILTENANYSNRRNTGCK
jgi:hypothetical protein